MKPMPVVLLAGGLGTRMREETEYKPKPMVDIGGRPVIWHIMKNLSQFDLTEFVVCAGYKKESLKEFFLNYRAFTNDFTISLNENSITQVHDQGLTEDWLVTISDTGELTQTGGRVNKIRKYVAGRRFLVTYGDGLSDIDIKGLIEFHKSHGKIATVSTVRPTSRFGVMDIDSSGKVLRFREKPQVEDWINIGFFIFEPEVFEYLDDDCILEQEPLTELARKGELYAFRHPGFWQPMDTFRESQMLNDLWNQTNAPWKNW